jgi:predicted MFS family arabinose efflux permease
VNLRSQFDNGLTPSARFKRGITRAVKITIYSPIILSFDIYMGLVYSYFYLLFMTFTPNFEDNYDFSSSTVGLSYVGVGAGFMVGQVVYATFGNRIRKIMAKKRGKE